MRSWLLGITVSVFCSGLDCGPAGAAEDGPPVQTVGWRGNWTGLFPDADPPTHWSRRATGVLSRVTCQAASPTGSTGLGRQAVVNGLIRDWLVIGPFPVADSVKDFAQEVLPGEAGVQPAEGDRVGQLAWRRWELKRTPDYERWGTTELDWVDLTEAVGYQPNQIAYAHTYLRCDRPGAATLVVDHGHGLKVWWNGQAVYTAAQQVMGLGSYVGISRQKQDLVHQSSPKIALNLQAGWNQLLVKVGSYNARGSRTCKFAARLLDAKPTTYDQTHLLWSTDLIERTNASPIIVGDRLFTPVEPDELACLDKHTGKILWRQRNDFYTAATAQERAAHEAFRERLAPLDKRLDETRDELQKLSLRREMRDLLVGLDKKRYDLKWDGHLASHFGIVGFTTTPVSDGRHVYTFIGQGVVACYDLDGRRQWIRRLVADEIRYSCSPAMIGGMLICVFGGLHALDAVTGNEVWAQPEVTSIAALIPGRICGTDVVSTRDGRIFRVADGKLLWANPHIRAGDTGWAAPVILGNVLYVPWTGVGELIVADFTEVKEEPWQPKLRAIPVAADHRRPGGEWLDRWTAGSPLIYEGRYYNIDQYGVFYAVDLASGQTLYKQDLGFDELHHYNAIGVGASATLDGQHIYVIDNQGLCAVLKPGPVFEQIAVNRLESLLPRDWPIPPQEILANGAPVFDGPRMYLRGERYLHCIARPPQPQ